MITLKELPARHTFTFIGVLGTACFIKRLNGFLLCISSLNPRFLAGKNYKLPPETLCKTVNE